MSNNWNYKTASYYQQKFARDSNVAEVWEYDVQDADRYTADKYSITVALVPTVIGYNVSMHANAEQTGVASYVEYWTFDDTELKLAKRTFREVKTVMSSLCKDLDEKRPPMAILTPKFRKALVSVAPGKKEHSGVFLFNIYQSDQDKEGDWRETLYGNRYPDKVLEPVDKFWGDQNDIERTIETRGTTPRGREYRYRYSHRVDNLVKIGQTTAGVNGMTCAQSRLSTLFGLTPAVATAFMLWLSSITGAPADEIERQLETDPGSLAPFVEQFEQNSTEPEYEPVQEQPAQEQDQFSQVLKETLDIEAGYVKNSVEESNYGVTRKTYKDYLKSRGLPINRIDMHNIPMEHVEEIYREMYWEESGSDRLPPVLARQVFDYAVNSGNSRSVKCLQGIVGSKPDGGFGPKTLAATEKYIQQHGEVALAQELLNQRIVFIKQFVKKRPEFKKGLMARMGKMQAQIPTTSKPMPIKPNSPKIRSTNVPERLVGEPISKQIGLVMVDDKMSSRMSDLLSKVGSHWGAVSEELRKQGIPRDEMGSYNIAFLRQQQKLA